MPTEFSRSVEIMPKLVTGALAAGVGVSRGGFMSWSKSASLAAIASFAAGSFREKTKEA